MKWNCGPSWEEKHEATKQWHRWFAWRPVRVGPRDCRWLEYVDRKGKWSDSFHPMLAGWLYQYRARQ